MAKRRSLKFKSESFEIESADGVAATYTLRELGGLDRDLYMVDMKKRVGKSPTGEDVITDPKGLQSFLLGLTLYGPDGKRVAAETVDSWPAAVVSDLYMDAMKLNGLTEEAARDQGKA